MPVINAQDCLRLNRELVSLCSLAACRDLTGFFAGKPR